MNRCDLGNWYWNLCVTSDCAAFGMRAVSLRVLGWRVTLSNWFSWNPMGQWDWTFERGL